MVWGVEEKYTEHRIRMSEAKTAYSSVLPYPWGIRSKAPSGRLRLQIVPNLMKTMVFCCVNPG